MVGITQERMLSRGDTAAMALFVIAGLAIVGWTIWFTIARIIELTSGHDVPVLVEFMNQQTDVQMGETTLPVELDRGTITVDGLGAIGVVPGVIGQIAFAVTITVVVACLIVLSRNLMRGRIFSRANTAIVMTGGTTGLVGAAAAKFFDNMLANAAMAHAVDGEFDTAVMSIEPFTFVLAAFALAVIGSVFVIGDRLQRDTEGLV